MGVTLITIFSTILLFITPTTSGDGAVVFSDSGSQFGSEVHLSVAPSSLILMNLDDDPCNADLDGNGSVGIGDLLIIFWAWISGDADSPADLNHDGIISVLDLLIFLAAYGTICK